MSSLVSIALASCNGAKYIETQIRSILAQSHRSLEVIVSDDASTDGTFEVVQKIAQEDPRVRVFQNPQRLGLVKNFLSALEHCGGDLVCFSDQDDQWEKDKIEVLAEIFQGDAEVALAYSDMEVCGEALEPKNSSFWAVSGIRPKKGRLFEQAFFRNLAPGCSMMFRRSVKDKVLKASKTDHFSQQNQAKILDDTPFMHDHLTFVAASLTGKISYSEKKLMKYRQHSSNSIGAFYRSDPAREKFEVQTRKKVFMLKEIGWADEIPRFNRIEQFSLALGRRSSAPQRLSWLRYYLYLRPDSLRDKLLGLLECVSPSLYCSLKKKKAL